MRKVTGYLTTDHQFFESETEAILYEAELDLTKGLEGFAVDPEKFINLIDKLTINIRRYIDALQAKRSEDKPATPVVRAYGTPSADIETIPERFARQHREAPRRFDNQNDAFSEERATTQQQFATRSDEHVSDLRRRIQPETLQDDRTVNGARMRGSDAPSVRRRPIVATQTATELAEALRQRREAHLRGEMDEDMESDREESETER